MREKGDFKFYVDVQRTKLRNTVYGGLKMLGTWEVALLGGMTLLEEVLEEVCHSVGRFERGTSDQAPPSAEETPLLLFLATCRGECPPAALGLRCRTLSSFSSTMSACMLLCFWL